MKENRELIEYNERPTEAEIISAIRDLDPDLCAEKTREDTRTVFGICITFLTALTDALTNIYLYMRTL